MVLLAAAGLAWRSLTAPIEVGVAYAQRTEPGGEAASGAGALRLGLRRHRRQATSRSACASPAASTRYFVEESDRVKPGPAAGAARRPRLRGGAREGARRPRARRGEHRARTARSSSASGTCAARTSPRSHELDVQENKCRVAKAVAAASSRRARAGRGQPRLHDAARADRRRHPREAQGGRRDRGAGRLRRLGRPDPHGEPRRHARRGRRQRGRSRARRAAASPPRSRPTRSPTRTTRRGREALPAGRTARRAR